MKILVIGGGGREHALVWRLKQSPQVEKIWCVPGNGGIVEDAECLAGDPGNVASLVSLAEKLSPDLTVVGPELPLVNGIGDAFRSRGWAIVAPSKEAAQLEGSKVYAKRFLERHGIPTAKAYDVCDSQEEAYRALETLTSQEWPVVIKADGLCAGKGVFLAQNLGEAREFVRRAMEGNELGEGGRRLLLEETLKGDELSFIILMDGDRYAPLVPTRDHKRVFEGDRGPNTGGMGAYSADELVPEELRQAILRTVVEPTIQGLRVDGLRYQGFLYFGLMLTDLGPQVLEFNCRLGDPETQAIVARMDFDLAMVLASVAKGQLEPANFRWRPGASVCVVLAAGGYPGKFERNQEISGITGIGDNTGVTVFHAGTRWQGDILLTNGGRVLGVTAAGRDLDAALALAYTATAKIRFEGMQYRRDIGATGSRAKVAGE